MATKTLSLNDPRHGTENGYKNFRCRCARCRNAHADYYSNGPGRDNIEKYRKHSGMLKRNYRVAREAGYSVKEAKRRSFWSDPLRITQKEG